MLVFLRNFPIGSDAGIILDLEHRPTNFVQMFQFGLFLLGILHHRPELIDADESFVQAQSLLNEKNRPPRSEFDKRGCDQKQRRSTR